MMRVTIISGLAIFAGCASVPATQGKFVAVRDHAMHIHCSGSESAGPTVIIEAGLRGVGAYYARLQNALESEVRVCTYDRAGLGWSDANGTPRNSRQMASDLHELLANADVLPPLI